MFLLYYCSKDLLNVKVGRSDFGFAAQLGHIIESYIVIRYSIIKDALGF